MNRSCTHQPANQSAPFACTMAARPDRPTRQWRKLAILTLCLLALVGCGARERTAARESTADVDEYTEIVIDGGGPLAPVAPAPFAHFNAAPATPTRIEVPAIGLDTPVVELGWNTKEDEAGNIFSEWNVAEFAAGWHMNSNLPGDGGNVVMSGHNNIAGAVFRELDQLKQGQEAYVYAGHKRYTYVIDKVLIVPDKLATMEQRQENARWIGDFDDDRLTLVSCWPRDDNSHRIIVVAHQQQDVTAVVQ